MTAAVASLTVFPSAVALVSALAGLASLINALELLWLARAGTFFAGASVPLTMMRLVDGGGLPRTGITLVIAAAGAGALVWFHGRVEGWRLALLAGFAALVLFLLRDA